jgi:hypothetical protein
MVQSIPRLLFTPNLFECGIVIRYFGFQYFNIDMIIFVLVFFILMIGLRICRAAYALCVYF